MLPSPFVRSAFFVQSAQPLMGVIQRLQSHSIQHSCFGVCQQLIRYFQPQIFRMEDELRVKKILYALNISSPQATKNDNFSPPFNVCIFLCCFCFLLFFFRTEVLGLFLFAPSVIANARRTCCAYWHLCIKLPAELEAHFPNESNI